MALQLAVLNDQLLALFTSPPATAAECASAWADALQAYATAIVPASTAVATAANALESALLSAFESGDAAAPMETAFTSFATTVGSGMAGFVATPPPAPVGFASAFAEPVPETHAEASSKYSNLIHTWMITGTATPSGGGSPQNWA